MTTARDIIEAVERDLDFAYQIAQTGGNTATIYVGGDDQVSIGPGHYNWGDPYKSEFDFGDLYVGPTEEEGEFAQVFDMNELVSAVEHYINLINAEAPA